MLITQGNAKYETGETSPKGQPIVITFTPEGYYKIDIEGVGGKPAICDEMFTTLKQARLGVARYLDENAGEAVKQKIIRSYKKTDG